MKHRPIMPSGGIRVAAKLTMSTQKPVHRRPFWELLLLAFLGMLSMLMAFLTLFVPLCDVRTVVLFSVFALLFFAGHAYAPEKTHYSLLIVLLAYAVFFYWKREMLAAGLMHIMNAVYQAIYYTDWEYFSTDPQYDIVSCTTISLCFAMTPVTWLIAYAVIRFHNFFLSMLSTFPFVELGLFFGVVPEHHAMFGLAAFWCGAAALQLASGKSKQRHKESVDFVRHKGVFHPLHDLKYLLPERACLLVPALVFGTCLLGEGTLRAAQYQRPETIKQMRTDFQYYAASLDPSDVNSVFPFLREQNGDDPDTVIELGRSERREFENRAVAGVSLSQLPAGRTYLRFSTYQSYDKSCWHSANDALLNAPVMQMFDECRMYPPEFLYYSVKELSGETAELELTDPNETLSRCVPYGFAPDDAVSFRGDLVSHTDTRSYTIFAGDNFENLLIPTISYDVPAGMLVDASPEPVRDTLHTLLSGREHALVQFPRHPESGAVYFGTDQELMQRSEAAVLAAAGYTDFVYETCTQLPDTDAMQYVHHMFADLTDSFDARSATPAETMILLGRLRDRLCANVEYSLSPGKTPPGEDYIRYFLEENKLGYCTHYATTGTILARMAGIPARYCEGYLIDPKALRLTETDDGMRYTGDILDSNAHAWIEVYLDGFGWIPFEFTFSYFTPPELPTEPVTEVVTEPVSADPTEPVSFTEMVTEFVPAAPEPESVPAEPVSVPEPPVSRRPLLAALGITAAVSAGILLIVMRRRAVIYRRELRLSDPIGDTAAVYAWRLMLDRLESCGVNTTAGSADALLQECLAQCSEFLTEEEIRQLVACGTRLRYSPHGLHESERTTVIAGYRKLTDGLYRRADPVRKLWLKWFCHYV